MTNWTEGFQLTLRQRTILSHTSRWTAEELLVEDEAQANLHLENYFVGNFKNTWKLNERLGSLLPSWPINDAIVKTISVEDNVEAFRSKMSNHYNSISSFGLSTFSPRRRRPPLAYWSQCLALTQLNFERVCPVKQWWQKSWIFCPTFRRSWLRLEEILMKSFE
jgi:hypothetical protein